MRLIVKRSVLLRDNFMFILLRSFIYVNGFFQTFVVFFYRQFFDSHGEPKAAMDREIERSMETCGLIPLNART